MRVYKVGLFLFFSGLCALIYQMVWLREMRLVFGASTPASAAVLAIFMGGLGVGGAVLGKWVDRKENPLKLYAHLELAIAALAALTLLLIPLVRFTYIWLGGAQVLGETGANALRLLLSTLVLGAPTFLMGGTLPAAVRAVETDEDAGRRNLGLLYGLNTLGAVTGVVLSVFLLLEIMGAKNTLICAALINVLVGLLARKMAVSLEIEGLAPNAAGPVVSAETSALVDDNYAPRTFVYIAALVAGFAFFLMELVWYRMLAPILGGSTYTFGLILAVALLGIGIGAALYAVREKQKQAGLPAFALACALEALCMAVPFALGDRIAVTAALIAPLKSMGMPGQVFGWTIITCLVVLPVAIVAGFQFPLLISLLGKGRQDVGRHIGYAYAWNTAGAILGSLAGGFGIFPLLSATGSWLLVMYILSALGGLALLISLFRGDRKAAWSLAVPAVLVLTVGLTLCDGPTAAWRQSPIGAGRVNLTRHSINEIQNWKNTKRRATIWEADGREATIGIIRNHSISFFVNGKSDGNALGDGSTQVMAGLISAALHPNPKTSFVIGLGTGCSAGWMAEVETMEKVDVAEMEKAVLEMARRCTPLNHDVLNHEKVEVIIADARELLLSSKRKYDLIVSEPSNPYRAGIASLYTREFYQSAAERLNSGGIFTQWVQAYEVDVRTVTTIYATLGSVFPHIETWETNSSDMLYVCSKEKIIKNADALRKRLDNEPFRTAMAHTWNTTGLEGFFSHFTANSSFGGAVAAGRSNPGEINLDDRMLIEFDFARTVGKKIAFNLKDLRVTARRMGLSDPVMTFGVLDKDEVLDNYMMSFLVNHGPPPLKIFKDPDRRKRAQAFQQYIRGNLKAALAIWKKQPRKPVYPLETAMLAETLADANDPQADYWIEQLTQIWPTEALAISMRKQWRNNETGQAMESLAALVKRLRSFPWSYTMIGNRALYLTVEMARKDPKLAPRLFELLREPFLVDAYHEKRLGALFKIAKLIDCRHCVEVIKLYEPHIPWRADFLNQRLKCYEETGDPMARAAERDNLSFYLSSSQKFDESLIRGAAGAD